MWFINAIQIFLILPFLHEGRSISNEKDTVQDQSICFYLFIEFINRIFDIERIHLCESVGRGNRDYVIGLVQIRVEIYVCIF